MWFVVGPTSGPVNITVRPVAVGAGRSRARTSNINDDGVGAAAADSEAASDVDAAAANTRTSSRVVTLNVDWSVRWTGCCCCLSTKVKVAHTRLPSVWFQSWSRFLAVCLPVTWVINPGDRLPLLSDRPTVTLTTLKRVAINFVAHAIGVNSLPKTVTRQRRGCNLNPSPSSSESSMLTTRLLSHLSIWTCSNVSVLWHCWLGTRKSIWPVDMSDEVLVWLSVLSEVQIVCIWSSWCQQCQNTQLLVL